MKRVFLVAGEVSGDTHGAALMRSLEGLDGKLTFAGLGGPEMRKVSLDVENWLDGAAVLGLWEVLKNYPWFRKKMNETVHRIALSKPDVVILIDYPGFNLELAKRLRKLEFPVKLIYYISPQVWAWKRGRIKTMATLLDRMICIFPFEKALYENSGLATDFAGHPLVDTMKERRENPPERDPDLVALLPGSREREIEALFPAMVEAAVNLKQERPHLQFAASAATESLAKRLRQIANEGRLHPNCLTIGTGDVHDVMQMAGVGVVASGTATLEAACLGLPYCLVYKVAWPTYVAGKVVVRIDYLGIVNVIAEREVVKELLQGKANGDSIAGELRRLLDNESVRKDLRDDLEKTVAELGEGGAHEKAAEAVYEAVYGGKQSAVGNSSEPEVVKLE